MKHPCGQRSLNSNRGGFCYELNGLFALLLRALGFQVDMLSAAVANSTGGFGPEFDHLTLLVHLEEDWIADVGFGESFRQPLRLQAALVQPQDGGSYRLERERRSLDLSRVGRRHGSLPTVLPYSHMSWVILPTCADYQQTSPESHFTQKRVCSLAKRSGRITLSDQLLDNDNRW